MTPITLYMFGPRFGAPDSSPFCLKAMVLLRMSGLPFVEDHTGFGKAPKGKLPFIDDSGTLVGDSTFIRMHLERVHGIDFDAGLTETERATGWIVERMLEEHTYWLLVHERWLEKSNFDRGPRRFFDAVPAPLRPFIVAMVRRKVKNSLHLQGLGRHSEAERHARAERDLAALAVLLRDKPYLFGDEPHGADASLFGFLASLLLPDIQPKLTALAAPHANLRAFTARMLARYFPDFRVGVEKDLGLADEIA